MLDISRNARRVRARIRSCERKLRKEKDEYGDCEDGAGERCDSMHRLSRSLCLHRAGDVGQRHSATVQTCVDARGATVERGKDIRCRAMVPLGTQ
jgi:hypothetical protein